MAPYSLMSTRADDVSCSNLRTLTWNCKLFLTLYDVNVANKSKANSEFSRVSFGEFFWNFARFEILTLPSTYYVLEKFCHTSSV